MRLYDRDITYVGLLYHQLPQHSVISLTQPLSFRTKKNNETYNSPSSSRRLARQMETSGDSSNSTAPPASFCWTGPLHRELWRSAHPCYQCPWRWMTVHWTCRGGGPRSSAASRFRRWSSCGEGRGACRPGARPSSAVGEGSGVWSSGIDWSGKGLVSEYLSNIYTYLRIFCLLDRL